MREQSSSPTRLFTRSRPHCKQVVIGLVLDREGFPKAHEVFDGNRQDRSSVDEMLQTRSNVLGARVEDGDRGPGHGL